MKAGPFNHLIAKVYGVDVATVTKFARLLKEGGLMTTGIRGVNAPDLIPLDAARLTVALLATDKPSRAVEMVTRFGAMTANESLSEGDRPSWWPKGFNPAFEDVLAEVMSGQTRATHDFQSAEIRATQGHCILHTRRGKVFFDGEALSEDTKAIEAGNSGIRVSRSVFAVDVIPVQQVFIIEKRPHRKEGA